MCGNPGTMKRRCSPEEIKYLDALVRGVYARRPLKRGQLLKEEDVYLVIPLQKGQMSCRELMSGQTLLSDVAADKPLMIEQVDSPYAYDDDIRQAIYQRGI
jgi:N-acetylneuraminate synthase